MNGDQFGGYTFQLQANGLMGSIYQNGTAVGRVFGNGSGGARVVALGTNDLASMQTAYIAYARSSAGASAGALPLDPSSPVGTPPLVAAQPAAPVAQQVVPFGQCKAGPPPDGDQEPTGTVTFEGGSQDATVTRSDGMIIKFDSKETKITCGMIKYEIRKVKGGAGKMFESAIMHPRNYGGSITGSGVEFLANGGVVYDTGMGHYGDMNTNIPLRNAKRIAVIAVAAVADVRKMPGHQDFTPPGYSDFAEVAQFKLRSDGSR